MALSHETATLQEVAAQLGRSEAWLRRNWAKLSAEHGFPRKLPCGPVWPRQLVEFWLRSGGESAGRAHSVNDNTGQLPPDYAAAIHQAYGVEL